MRRDRLMSPQPKGIAMTSLTRRTALAALATAPLALIASRAAAATYNVDIANFAFAPATLDIAVGDTVIFTNSDGAPHTATAVDGSFDTGRLNRNDSGQVTITAAGTYDYICTFHPSMKGVITAS